MTQSELKEKLYELVTTYFSGATVIWGMTGAVNPNSPLVTLNLSDVTRSYHPIKSNRDGVPVNAFPSTTKLQIDLFTKGREVAGGAGGQVTAKRENTAVNDMSALLNFLDSDYVIDWCYLNDINITVNQIRDLTQLINSASWDYRAMCEVDIGFMQGSVGYSGTMWENGVAYDEYGNVLRDENGNPLTSETFEENTLSGGSKELANGYTGWFEKVEIEEEREK